jgi:hypothetical protein
MACTHSPARTHNTLELAFGVSLVIFGAVLTLDVLGVGDVMRLLRIWPVALVVAGVAGLSRASDSGSRLWSWAWIVIGGWLLLRTFGLTRIGFWELVWPVAIIALGVKLGLDAWRRPSKDAAAPDPVASNASHLVAIFGGSKRQVQERPFLGASMTACLGGCELDLRHSDIPPGGEAVIELFALLGGHEIRIPDHWAVVSQVTSIGAGLDDKRGIAIPAAAATAPPRLIVRGVLILSGVTIQR